MTRINAWSHKLVAPLCKLQGSKRVKKVASYSQEITVIILIVHHHTDWWPNDPVFRSAVTAWDYNSNNSLYVRNQWFVVTNSEDLNSVLQNNIMLGNPGSWHSCGWQLTKNIRQNTLANKAHTQKHQHTTMTLVPQQDNLCSHSAKKGLRKSLRNVANSFKSGLVPKTLPDPNLIEHPWVVLRV